MEYTIESTEANDYLVLKVLGRFDDTTADSIIQDFELRLRDTDKDKVLIDLHAVEIKTDIFGEYRRHSNVNKSSLAKTSRVAIWASGSNRKTNGFVETTVRNRGINLKVFYDKASALNWLNNPDSATQVN